MKPYHIKPIYRSIDRWYVVGKDGIPIYDNAPYGKDKPLIFKDPDSAQECVDRLNLEDEEGE